MTEAKEITVEFTKGFENEEILENKAKELGGVHISSFIAKKKPKSNVVI